MKKTAIKIIISIILTFTFLISLSFSSSFFPKEDLNIKKHHLKKQEKLSKLKHFFNSDIAKLGSFHLKTKESIKKSEIIIKTLLNEVKKRKQLKKKNNNNDDIVPLIIIPCLFGSQLKAKLDKPKSKYFYCSKKSDWYTLWIDLLEFAEVFRWNCLFENIKLYYNYNSTSKTCQYDNYPGVKTRTFDVGGIKSIEYVDREHVLGLWDLVIKLLKKLGYTVGKNLKAYPYDWRVAANGVNKQYEGLKRMVEETYRINGNKKVAFSSLSMGGNWFLLFLNNYVTQEWKDKYVYSFSSFCSPWGGSSRALSAAISLHQEKEFGIPIPMMSNIRDFIQNIPASQWMFPIKKAYGDIPVVTSPKRNYSSSLQDYLDLFHDKERMKNVLIDNEKLRNQVDPPNVPFYCVHSYNQSTIGTVNFKTNDFKNEKDVPVTWMDGDTTVLVQSLSMCKNWKQEKHPIHYEAFPNIAHGLDLHDIRCVRVLLRALNL